MRFLLNSHLMSGRKRMISFKEISQIDFRKPLLAPTVVSEGFGYKLALRFDKKENLLEARYAGNDNIWFNTLCYFLEGKNYLELKNFNKNSLKYFFQDDATFIECFEDFEQKVFHPSFELLNLALDTYKGQLRTYSELSKIVCRCSGTTEEDILSQIHEAESLNDLSIKSAAGLGCRSCIKQLEKYFSRKTIRRFKDVSNADWILKAEALLEKSPFKDLEIKSFKNGMLILSSRETMKQQEEEEVTLALQDYFESLDPDLSVLLASSQALK